MTWNRWEIYESRLHEILAEGTYLNTSVRTRFVEQKVTISFEQYAVYEAWLMADQPCRAFRKDGQRCKNRCRWHDDPNTFNPNTMMRCHHHRSTSDEESL